MKLKYGQDPRKQQNQRMSAMSNYNTNNLNMTINQSERGSTHIVRQSNPYASNSKTTRTSGASNHIRAANKAKSGGRHANQVASGNFKDESNKLKSQMPASISNGAQKTQ